MKIAFDRTRRSRLDRRSFLRGAGGVALGLPFLESLPERSAWAQSAEPVFSLFLVHSCGVVADTFWPDDAGPLTTDGLAGSGKAVAALAPYASHLLMVRGLKFPRGNSGCGHAQGLCQVLTGAEHDGGGGNRAMATAASVDTLIAEAVNPAGVDPLALYAGLKGGYINERISFLSAGQVRSAESNPYEVYKDLVGLAPTSPMGSGVSEPVDPMEMQAVVDELAVRRNSVNDLVREQIIALKNNQYMSQADRERLDRHLEGIRDIETTMASTGMTTVTLAGGVECSQQSVDEARYQAIDRGFRNNGSQEEVSLLHMELAAFAFACGINRTAALQVGDGTDATVYNVPSNARGWGFHHISHRIQDDGGVGSDQQAVEAHREIDALRMETFKQGIDAFASYTTATGNLLDNSVVLWTNCINDGPAHSFNDIPTIIAGTGGGYLKQGQYIQVGSGGFNGGVDNGAFLNSIKAAVGAPAGDPMTEILV